MKTIFFIITVFAISALAQKYPENIRIPLDQAMYKKLLSNPNISPLREEARRRAYEYIEIYDKEFYKINNLSEGDEFVTPKEQARVAISDYLDRAKDKKLIVLSENFPQLKKNLDNGYKWTFEVYSKRKSKGLLRSSATNELNDMKKQLEEIKQANVALIEESKKLKQANTNLQDETINDLNNQIEQLKKNNYSLQKEAETLFNPQKIFSGNAGGMVYFLLFNLILNIIFVFYFFRKKK